MDELLGLGFPRTTPFDPRSFHLQWVASAIAFGLALSTLVGAASADLGTAPTVRGDGPKGLASGIPGPATGDDYRWTNPFPDARSGHALAYDSESDCVVLFGGTLVSDTWAYDVNANAWTNLNPAAMPAPRGALAMAYDAGSDRIILFGGRVGMDPTNETWGYDSNANAWTNLDPVVRPSARSSHAMAYDAGSDRIIMFGGVGAAGTRLNDTWAYDFDGNTWTELAPSVHPPARVGPAMAYDAQSDRVVLFGGLPPQGDASNQTWSYDVDTDTWAQVNASVAPSRRYDSAMVYDFQSDRIVLFGGRTLSTATASTWALDLDNETWTMVGGPVSPMFRYGHAMAYDSESDRVVLFAGAPGHWSLNPPKDTWSYDLESDEWTVQLDSPPFLRDHAMAYDAESDRVILFGGCCTSAGANLDDTWAYDADVTLWTRPNPGDRPTRRSGHAMAYDSESDRVILFGGRAGPNSMNETWTFDFNANTWTNMAPPSSPSRRAEHAMAYDAESDRVILLGGSSGSDETWSYDFNANEWTDMAPVIHPPGRARHAMAYDEGSDRVILFGGSSGGDETWAYDFNTNVWLLRGLLEAPSGRSGPAMAYDAQSDRVILFGGESDSGFRDETWSYDYELDSWTELHPDARPSARSRHAMAYDASSDTVVLFGGRGASFAHSDETWMFYSSVAGLLPVLPIEPFAPSGSRGGLRGLPDGPVSLGKDATVAVRRGR